MIKSNSNKENHLTLNRMGINAEELSDVKNHRVRAVVTNLVGDEITVDYHGQIPHKHLPKSQQGFKCCCHMSIYPKREGTNYRASERNFYEYSFKNILNHMNRELKCNFKTISLV